MIGSHSETGRGLTVRPCSSLLGLAFFPVWGFDLPSIGVSLPQYGQTASPPWILLWGALGGVVLRVYTPEAKGYTPPRADGDSPFLS